MNSIRIIFLIVPLAINSVIPSSGVSSSYGIKSSIVYSEYPYIFSIAMSVGLLLVMYKQRMSASLLPAKGETEEELRNIFIEYTVNLNCQYMTTNIKGQTKRNQLDDKKNNPPNEEIEYWKKPFKMILSITKLFHFFKKERFTKTAVIHSAEQSALSIEKAESGNKSNVEKDLDFYITEFKEYKYISKFDFVFVSDRK
jgi:hypothetical protein